MNSFPHVTALTAGVLVSLQMLSQFSTSVARGRYLQGLGHGNHKPLEMAIRRHGNLVENVPFLLIVLRLMDLGGLAGSWLAIFATVVVRGRLSHAIWFSISPDRPHPLRFLGWTSTLFVGLDGGAWLIRRTFFNG